MNASPRAIIFDMDETLVATGALWRRAETGLLTKIGHEWSAQLASTFKGMNAFDVARTIHKALKPKLAVEECCRIMREGLFQAFEEGPIAPMPGALECIQRAASIAPLALASGSPLPLIELALTQLGVKEKFALLVSSESVPRGKPNPDVFLAVAATSGVTPSNCLVFEDSLVGVQAAKAANMMCIAVPSSRSTRIRDHADKVFASLDQVTTEEIEAMIALM